MPGWTWTVRVMGSTGPILFMYFEKSRMTAALQPWPASEVPAPRERMGALRWRQISTVAMTSCFVEGNDEADGDVAVVGGVGGIESARARVETDFAADSFAELVLELGCAGEGFVVARVRAGQKDKGRCGHGSPEWIRLFYSRRIFQGFVVAVILKMACALELSKLRSRALFCSGFGRRVMNS